jgi:long-chain acyl-CoA synthetase
MIENLLSKSFGTVNELIDYHADQRPQHLALIEDNKKITYKELKNRINSFAKKLLDEKLQPQDKIAICASSSIEYAVAFLGALKVGIAVAPLAPSSSGPALASMIVNSEAKILFFDNDTKNLIDSIQSNLKIHQFNLSDPVLQEEYSKVVPQVKEIQIKPDWAFNLIYSSGTTGTPKGIVQPHSMRWAHVQRGVDSGYGHQSVVMISTPLYSNTTLVSFFPGISLGGTLVLMKKFNANEFLVLAQKYKATHAMLVPVQYQRIMATPDFDKFDLSSFQNKFCTSAPFRANLKKDILDRWPGGLTEYYGMTEGGGTVILKAHLFPHKLHTVGQPATTSDIRLINEDGIQVEAGEMGEVVGRSPAMMKEYYRESEKTKEAEWFSPEGLRFIRTGDVGRFDEEGFLTLLDRKKDMIISGGFNVYPSDIETLINTHPEVYESAVVGVHSEDWGETPVAFVVLKETAKVTTEDLKAWLNQQLGKTQRVVALVKLDELPRSHIGKILKKDLKNMWEVSHVK